MNLLVRSTLYAVLSFFSVHVAAYSLPLPGKGISVQPLRSPIKEETFQTLLVMRGLEKLGYNVKPIREVDYPAAHRAIANGEATFMANHWDPLHNEYYQNAGGDKKLWRNNEYSPGALQGYLIDKKTADTYRITHIDQLRDPKIAHLFDSDNDGRANLIGCNKDWGCAHIIEHHIQAYKLNSVVQHIQGHYPTLISHILTRHQKGKPILYYAWTPHWINATLKPGKDVIWLEVPFSSLPNPEHKKRLDTKQLNGKNYGFMVNTQRILANRKFIENNPPAAALFKLMMLPVEDISIQNQAMNQGKNKLSDIQHQVDSWIRINQKTFDEWVRQASRATN